MAKWRVHLCVNEAWSSGGTLGLSKYVHAFVRKYQHLSLLPTLVSNKIPEIVKY